MDWNYMVYCHQCHGIVAMAETREEAEHKKTYHVLNSPHLFIAVYDRDEAKKRGILWPEIKFLGGRKDMLVRTAASIFIVLSQVSSIVVAAILLYVIWTGGWMMV